MPIVLMPTRKTMKNLVNKITKFYTGLTEIHHLQTGKNKFNKTIFISIGVHFIAVGGFSFTISGYFDIIVGFRILNVIAIPTLAFA
jgi:hypothetical protein